MFITTDLCPSDCSGHGTCKNGTCICHSGFIGEACVIDSRKPPSLDSIVRYPQFGDLYINVLFQFKHILLPFNKRGRATSSDNISYNRNVFFLKLQVLKLVCGLIWVNLAFGVVSSCEQTKIMNLIQLVFLNMKYNNESYTVYCEF